MLKPIQLIVLCVADGTMDMATQLQTELICSCER
jgi:hypothetical protein